MVTALTMAKYSKQAAARCTWLVYKDAVRYYTGKKMLRPKPVELRAFNDELLAGDGAPFSVTRGFGGDGAED
jgi:hypothetical protein